ncbi:hypothetical protein C2E23DRAFT_40212 [Lenzites betulinus]|nr:hypothetical protein C2E23DRAFT_40212 [Lenzites betulinus]
MFISDSAAFAELGRASRGVLFSGPAPSPSWVYSESVLPVGLDWAASSESASASFSASMGHPSIPASRCSVRPASCRDHASRIIPALPSLRFPPAPCVPRPLAVPGTRAPHHNSICRRRGEFEASEWTSSVRAFGVSRRNSHRHYPRWGQAVKFVFVPGAIFILVSARMARICVRCQFGLRSISDVRTFKLQTSKLHGQAPRGPRRCTRCLDLDLERHPPATYAR